LLIGVVESPETSIYRKISTKNVENFLVVKSVRKWRKAVLLHYKKCYPK
jgi:hypothetical protein